MFGWRAATLVFTSIFLTACGSLQSVKLAEVPAQWKGTPTHLSAERPAKNDIAGRAYEIEGKSSFFQQTASGGSLAVGLLFGPLGVMANRANIDRITKEMGQSGQAASLFQVDALEEAAAALNMAPEKMVSGDAVISMKPYLLFFVVDEKVGVNTMVGFRLEAHSQKSDKNPAWIGHYNYVLPTAKSMDVLKNPLAAGELNQYKNDVHEGYQQLRQEMLRDFSGSPPPPRKIAWVNSPVLGIGAPGDVETNASGRMSLRVDMNNYGPGVAKTISYATYVFPVGVPYRFIDGPVDREEPKK